MSSRIQEAGKGKGQGRLSKEERLAMESWMQQDRVYTAGAPGRAMTNLRWLNGGGSKGLKTANVDSKDATQVGAYTSLANYVNNRLRLVKAWTADTAMGKWKNMKTSFKRICKENQFPLEREWLASGRNKEDMAQEIERITKIRRQKHASYDVLWAEFHNHPSINPAGRYESTDADADDDAHEEEDDDDVDEAGEGQPDQEEGATSPMKHGKASTEASTHSGAASPRPQAQALHKSTRSPKAQPVHSPKKKMGPKDAAGKFKFKKASDAPRHRDITAAYIAMKAEWNRMWLRVQVLKERREVYFLCRDRGFNSDQCKLAFDDIGLGQLPAYMASWGEDPLDASFKGPAAPDAAEDMRNAADGGVMSTLGGDDDDEGSEGSGEGEGD
jgi:hypothetical protein